MKGLGKKTILVIEGRRYFVASVYSCTKVEKQNPAHLFSLLMSSENSLRATQEIGRKWQLYGLWDLELEDRPYLNQWLLYDFEHDATELLSFANHRERRNCELFDIGACAHELTASTIRARRDEIDRHFEYVRYITSDGHSSYEAVRVEYTYDNNDKQRKERMRAYLCGHRSNVNALRWDVPTEEEKAKVSAFQSRS